MRLLITYMGKSLRSRWSLKVVFHLEVWWKIQQTTQAGSAEEYSVYFLFYEEGFIKLYFLSEGFEVPWSWSWYNLFEWAIMFKEETNKPERLFVQIGSFFCLSAILTNSLLAFGSTDPIYWRFFIMNFTRL